MLIPTQIVRTSGLNPDTPPEHRPYLGYNAMAYRHTASQLAERAGELWNHDHPARCRDPKTGRATYCEPRVFEAEADRLFRNDGGRFVDVSAVSGIGTSSGSP